MSDREAVPGVNRPAMPERRAGVETKASLVGACIALLATFLLAAVAAATLGPIAPALLPGDASQTESASWISGWIGSVVTLLVSFFLGGYAAARLARHHAPVNGLAAAAWALAGLVLIAVAGAVLGAEFDLFTRLNLPNWQEQFAEQVAEAVIGGLIWLGVMFGSAWVGASLGARSAGEPPGVA